MLISKESAVSVLRDMMKSRVGYENSALRDAVALLHEVPPATLDELLDAIRREVERCD